MQKLIFNISSLLGIREDGKTRLSGAELNTPAEIHDAWIYIKDGFIEDYGSMKDLPERPGAERIDALGGMVLPAFCDSHSHIVFAATREQEFEDRITGLSYEEIAARGGGILNSVKKLRAMSEDELYESSYVRCLEVMKMGTGSLEIKSGYGLDLDSEMKMLRVAKRLAENLPINIKTTLLAAHAFPPEYADDYQGYVDHICDTIIPKVAEEGLADYIDAFCERGYFDAKQTSQILECGVRHAMKPKVHVNQFSSCGGVQASLEHDALTIDHLEVMEGDDMKDLLASKTIATALPACSFFLSIPYTPARSIIDGGGTLALATDYNPGSSPTGNMSFVISLACIKMNMTPTEAIHAATLNGAAAMELSSITGSISRKKRADLILTRPIENSSLLAYRFGDMLISKVFHTGRLAPDS